MAADLEKVLSALVPAGVKFIVIGGWAAALHGSARSTIDVEVAYDPSRTNIQALVAALQRHTPYLRDAPPGLPFAFEERTISRADRGTRSTPRGTAPARGQRAASPGGLRVFWLAGKVIREAPYRRRAPAQFGASRISVDCCSVPT
jgi:hypothetical protein